MWEKRAWGFAGGSGFASPSAFSLLIGFASPSACSLGTVLTDGWAARFAGPGGGYVAARVRRQRGWSLQYLHFSGASATAKGREGLKMSVRLLLKRSRKRGLSAR